MVTNAKLLKIDALEDGIARYFGQLIVPHGVDNGNSRFHEVLVYASFRNIWESFADHLLIYVISTYIFDYVVWYFRQRWQKQHMIKLSYILFTIHLCILSTLEGCQISPIRIFPKRPECFGTFRAKRR